MVEKNNSMGSMFDVLTSDDWSLTLKELRGQRVQLLLQLSVVDAGISFLEGKVDDD